MKLKIWTPEVTPLVKEMLETKYINCKKCGTQTVEILSLGEYGQMCRTCEKKARGWI